MLGTPYTTFHTGEHAAGTDINDFVKANRRTDTEPAYPVVAGAAENSDTVRAGRCASRTELREGLSARHGEGRANPGPEPARDCGEGGRSTAARQCA